MGVIINEFEVMADTQPAEPQLRTEGSPETAPQANPTHAVATVLRALSVQSLRAWAH
jgi:hypothetical protein